MSFSRLSPLALVACFALSVPLATASCKGAAGKGGKAVGMGSGSGSSKGPRSVAFAVDVLDVQAEQVDYVVQAAGTLEAFERVQVTARVAGVVDKVSFTEGQDVKKGDLLVVIESERYQLALNTAKANQAKALASLADAEAMVARREKASQEHPGLIPAEELATFKTKALTAKADAAAVAESVKIAQVNLRDAHVRAPMAGVIQTRTIETGQYVQAGYLMATLLRSDPMLLKFQVDPRDAPRIKPGMIATFTIRDTQRVYQAKLTLVSGSAEAATHTVGVIGEVIDEGHKYWLRPGTFCDVLITMSNTRPAPLIPRTATRATDKGYIVYVVRDGVATERPVVLGMNTKDGRIEVRSGLEAGEQIVVRGAEALSNGALVKPTKVPFKPEPVASISGVPNSDASVAPSASAPPASSGSGGGKGKWKKGAGGGAAP